MVGVIESDTLARDEVGAVCAYLRRRLHYGLHCIVDTGGKSLHAWFDAPPNKVFETRLKAGLEVFGFDPKVFSYSQAARVLGGMGSWRGWCGSGTKRIIGHGGNKGMRGKGAKFISRRCW